MPDKTDCGRNVTDHPLTSALSSGHRQLESDRAAESEGLGPDERQLESTTAHASSLGDVPTPHHVCRLRQDFQCLTGARYLTTLAFRRRPCRLRYPMKMLVEHCIPVLVQRPPCQLVTSHWLRGRNSFEFLRGARHLRVTPQPRRRSRNGITAGLRT